VRILPPLIIEKTEADRFLQAMGAVMEELDRFPGAAWTATKNLADITTKSI